MMNLLRFCRDNKVSVRTEYNAYMTCWIFTMQNKNNLTLQRAISVYELEETHDPDGIIKIVLEHMLTELNKGTV